MVVLPAPDQPEQDEARFPHSPYLGVVSEKQTTHACHSQSETSMDYVVVTCLLLARVVSLALSALSALSAGESTMRCYKYARLLHCLTSMVIIGSQAWSPTSRGVSYRCYWQTH